MTVISDRARAAATHCEARLHGFRRTKDGVAVTFSIHPAEVPQSIAIADLGTRYMLALVEIGDDETPVEPQKAAPIVELKSARKWHDMRPSQQAGMLCADPLFLRWIQERHNKLVTDAAQWVREQCSLDSRAELNTNNFAVLKWHHLTADFFRWKNEPAE